MVFTSKVSKPKTIQTWVKPTKSISSKWITDQKFILSKLDSTCLASLLIWAPSMNWKCLVFPTLIRTSWTEVLISSIFISNSFSVSSLFNLMFSHSSESERGNYDFCNIFSFFLTHIVIIIIVLWVFNLNLKPNCFVTPCWNLIVKTYFVISSIFSLTIETKSL